MHLETTIRPGQPEELPQIGQVLAHAFDEPVTHWLVPDPARHQIVMPSFFTEIATDAMDTGIVDVLYDSGSGYLLGAAVWFDLTHHHSTATTTDHNGYSNEDGDSNGDGDGDGATTTAGGDDTSENASDDGDADAGDAQRWAGVFGPDVDRWTLLGELMSRSHYGEPHWYLMCIGIRPYLQRHGLGTQLLVHRHRRLGPVPAYLEATSPDSRRLYGLHGYTDLGELPIPGGPSMWRMLRPPLTEVDATGVNGAQRASVG